MATKKYYSINYMRIFAPNHSYISSDGKCVKRQYKDSLGVLTTYEPQITQDCEGRNLIVLKNFPSAYIDEMVMHCWKGPRPNDGKKYFIRHNDGDISNDDVSNLEWVEATEENFAAAQVSYDIFNKMQLLNYFKKKLKIKVTKDGKVFQNKEELHPHHEGYDSDTDLSYHSMDETITYSFTNHWGNGETNKIDVDKLMYYFGFVAGDPELLDEPVILHKDKDFTNHNTDNLEWCEKDDPRYIEFRRITKIRNKKEDIEDNYFDRPSPSTGRKKKPTQYWVDIYGPVDDPDNVPG